MSDKTLKYFDSTALGFKFESMSVPGRTLKKILLAYGKGARQ